LQYDQLEWNGSDLQHLWCMFWILFDIYTNGH